MGGSDSKLNFRKAVVQLTTKKTVGQVVVTSFAANLSNSVSQGSAKWPLHLIGNSLARSLMVNRLLFSGSRSNGRHVLGSILVRVVGEYKRRLHFDSSFRNQGFTGRKSIKLGDALLQGGQ